MTNKPIFIAEIGMNSDGNFDLNHELIRCAAAAGADIAKFQIGWRGAVDDINFIDYDRLQKLITGANISMLNLWHQLSQEML